MKLFSMLFILCTMTSLNFAMRIQMPSAKDLNNQLTNYGLANFTFTDIIDRLAEKEVNAQQINDAINNSLKKYEEQSKFALAMRYQKGQLIEALLKNFPKMESEVIELHDKEKII